jgi:hypothetical protein
MDMNTNKFLFFLFVLGLQTGLVPTESFFSLTAEVKKNCFLTFHSPPRLRFHEKPVSADRSNLLRLGDPVTQGIEVVADEGNVTTEIEDFPLTSYGEAKAVDEEPSEMPDLLPPADPFIDYTLGSSSVDSTDQLIQLFENLEQSGNPSSRVSVNFIPPYSTDSGNFKVQSSASYTRRVRK